MSRLCFIDWDHKRLTAVVAECLRGKAKVLDSWSEDTDLSPNPLMVEELGQLLKDRLKSRKMAVTGLIALIGRDRLIVRDQKYPVVTAAEEPGLVRLLTTREMLDDPQDVIIDYQPWSNRPSQGEHRALVFVLRREMLGTYEAIAKGAGLKLLGLLPRAVGLAAAMPAGTGARGLIAVGQGWRELLVVREGAVELDRGLADAGNMAQEARRGFAVFATTGGAMPGRIFATGAGLGEMDRLGEVLEVSVEDLELEGRPAPGAGQGSLIALMGAARVWSQDKPSVDFVHPRMPISQVSDSTKRMYLYGAAAAALLIVVSSAYWWHASGKQSELDKIRAHLDETKLGNTRLVEDEKKLKELANWDTANWLEELVDLACRVSDTKKILLTEITATPQPTIGGLVSPYSGRVEIKGVLPESTGDETELDKLDRELRKAGPDGYYLTKLRRTGKQFVLELQVKPRSPQDYVLVPPPRPAKEKGTKADSTPGLDGIIGANGSSEKKTIVEPGKDKLKVVDAGASESGAGVAADKAAPSPVKQGKIGGSKDGTSQESDGKGATGKEAGGEK